MQQISMQLALKALLFVFVTIRASGVSLRKIARDVPQKDVVIPNPMKHSIGAMIPTEPPSVPKEPQYAHTYIPVSPPHAPDVSPTDPQEVIDGWEGKLAKYIDNFNSNEGMRFEGSTCQSVCAACAIHAAQQSDMCFCYATCQMGECGNGGALPHIGWSNNEVSTPRTLWRANCNVGVKNCEAECMKEKTLKGIEKCKNEKGNPADCFHRLSQQHQPLPHDARKQVHYCIREGMEECDTFLYAPKEKEWQCYNEASKCTDRAVQGFRAEVESYQPPSVWETIVSQR